MKNEIMRQADTLRRSDKLVQAEALFMQLVESRELDHEVMFLGGLIAKQRGQLNSSIRRLLAAHLDAPENQIYLTELAKVSLLANDPHSALDYATEAEKVGGSTKLTAYVLARAFCKIGRIREAHEEVKHYRAAGGSPQAIASLQQGIRLAELWCNTRKANYHCSEAQVFPGVFRFRDAIDANHIQAVRSKFGNLVFSPGTVMGPGAQGGVLNTKTRRASVSELSLDGLSRNIHRTMFSRVKQVADFLGLAITAPSECLQATLYRAYEGGFYDWHKDIGVGRFKARTLSVSVLVSIPKDYDGGALEFRSGGQSFDLGMSAGDIVIFRSSIAHRVTKVSGADRRTLVAWFDAMMSATPEQSAKSSSGSDATAALSAVSIRP